MAERALAAEVPADANTSMRLLEGLRDAGACYVDYSGYMDS